MSAAGALAAALPLRLSRKNPRITPACASREVAAPEAATLTAAGVVALSPAGAEAERTRLEGTDAFAELVKLSSLAPGAAGQPPSAAAAAGLRKPPWLRQRAPQGERCAGGAG